MGIDLNKPIGKGMKSQYPSKRTMNLAQTDAKSTKSTTVLYVILGVVVLIAILKFGVYDLFAKAATAENEVATVQAQITSNASKMADYQTIASEYALYSYGYQTSEESQLVDRLTMLDVVERYVMPLGTVSSVSLSENTANISLSGVTLASASGLITTLEGVDGVDSVSVNTASNSAGTTTTGTTGSAALTVVITFADAQSSATANTAVEGTEDWS